MTYETILADLNSMANNEIAKHSQRFFKTGKGEYGEGDVFIGIRVPVIRQAVKKYKSTSITQTKRLLHSKIHEVRLFALLMLVAKFNQAKPAEQHKIFKLYFSNTKYINNWDLVDSSAHHIVGAYLIDKDRSILFDLALSNSLWERRIAMMSSYHFIKNQQFGETLHLAKILLNDEQDLIHKVVGWMLREIGKRNKALEVAFLNEHYQTMPRTMLRYAIEKFDVLERKKYLLGQV